ncbi:hypothetical protein, partial [Candidatus Epulonipiscium viviparus]
MPTNAALNILFHSKINGDLTELLDLKDYMAKQIIGDSKIAERVVKEDNIAFLQKQEIKRILGDRKKNNLTRSAEQNDQISKYNPFIYMEISQINNAINLNIKSSLIANYYFKGYRTTKITIQNMNVSDKTIFEVKNQTNMYANEKFSLAFTEIKNGKIVGYS